MLKQLNTASPYAKCSFQAFHIFLLPAVEDALGLVAPLGILQLCQQTRPEKNRRVTLISPEAHTRKRWSLRQALYNTACLRSKTFLPPFRNSARCLEPKEARALSATISSAQFRQGRLQ